MKNFKIYFMLVALFLSFSIIDAQDTPEKIVDLAKTKLVGFASAPEVIEAVKAQNAKNVSLEEIKSIDQKWIATSGIDDFMNSMLANKCSGYLKGLQKSNKFLDEIFVMDNKGANVAMTNKTSDYWQGDEDKFIKSYNNGNGTIHYGKVSFDESSQTYLIQVSVPVVENGKTIGAVTFGVDYTEINK